MCVCVCVLFNYVLPEYTPVNRPKSLLLCLYQQVDKGAKQIHRSNGQAKSDEAVAETTDEVLEVVEEPLPHTNFPPEAIVREVEAAQVAAPVEANGAAAIVSA